MKELTALVLALLLCLSLTPPAFAILDGQSLAYTPQQIVNLPIPLAKGSETLWDMIAQTMTNEVDYDTANYLLTGYESSYTTYLSGGPQTVYARYTATYDDCGRLVTVDYHSINGNWTTDRSYQYTYNDQGWLIKERTQSRVLFAPEPDPIVETYEATYTYETDGRGNPAKITEKTRYLNVNATETLTYVLKYDEQDRLIRVGFPGKDGTETETFYWSYNAAGQKVGERAYDHGSSQSLAYAYDDRGNLTTITITDAEGRGSDVRYTYDTAGNLTSFTNSWGPTCTYTYDEGGRMTRQAGSFSASDTYDRRYSYTFYEDGSVKEQIMDAWDPHRVLVYDRAGNRIRWEEPLYDNGIKGNTLMTTTYTYVEKTPAQKAATAKASPTVAGFLDVHESDYYAKAVQWAVDQGVTTGTSAATFSPEQIVTRGQAVTFLWRAMGSPEPDLQANPFTDVKETDYFYKPVLWAVEQGITNGTSASSFSPNQSVTRGQLITFLWRAEGRPGDTGAALWYADPEAWAVEKGLLAGTAASYQTDAPCPRSDVVFYLWRNLSR